MQKTYRVIEAAPSGQPEDERTGIYVDNLDGERILLETGTQFTATLREEEVYDRRFLHTPTLVKTGRWLVEAADVDVRPGCLDSIISTGRAVDIAAEPKKPAKKKTKKK